MKLVLLHHILVSQYFFQLPVLVFNTVCNLILFGKKLQKECKMAKIILA